MSHFPPYLDPCSLTSQTSQSDSAYTFCLKLYQKLHRTYLTSFPSAPSILLPSVPLWDGQHKPVWWILHSLLHSLTTIYSLFNMNGIPIFLQLKDSFKIPKGGHFYYLQLHILSTPYLGIGQNVKL